jgi:hypothetical protein
VGFAETAPVVGDDVFCSVAIADTAMARHGTAAITAILLIDILLDKRNPPSNYFLPHFAGGL